MSLLERRFVLIAIRPIFTPLQRPNNRVPRFVKVCGRVFVLRVVAAADLAAGHAHAQMHPAVPELHTLFAPGRQRRNGMGLRGVAARGAFPLFVREGDGR